MPILPDHKDVQDFGQSLWGHASLATTGRYLQLTDQMAKQIALNTETAFDGSAFSQEESKVREVHPQYHQDSEFELWDEYVTDVLEWLSRPIA